MTGHRKYHPANVRYTIRPESAGNGTIHDRDGNAVAVLEDWTLFIDGERIADIDNYRDAIIRTEAVLTAKS